jgi:shikimate dehydrogenase
MEAQMNIGGNTKIAGIVGNPIRHSLSPKIHNYLFGYFGIDAVYLPFEIDSEESIESFTKTFQAAKMLGANITIPYKTTVLPFVDELSDRSKLTGAANTLSLKNGKLYADTTDYAGFLAALKSDGFNIEGKSVMILGNGGTAKTLATLLAHSNIVKNIFIVGRNIEKVNKLGKEIKEKVGCDTALFCATPDTLQSFDCVDIIVNCTSVGMSPNLDESPLNMALVNPKTYLFDAIYNPLETKFLREGRARGCCVQNGLRMLIAQAFCSFSIWTGEKTDDVSLEELENLLLKELNK